MSRIVKVVSMLQINKLIPSLLPAVAVVLSAMIVSAAYLPDAETESCGNAVCQYAGNGDPWFPDFVPSEIPCFPEPQYTGDADPGEWDGALWLPDQMPSEIPCYPEPQYTGDADPGVWDGASWLPEVWDSDPWFPSF